MNVITLSAVRFTKELELKRSSNNTAILNFSVADNMKVNGEDKTIYLQCSAFGKQAEYLAQYGMKGGRVTVVGSLQPNNYTNKDGQRVEGMQIHVDRVELIDFKPKADNQAPSQQMQPQMNMNQGMPQMPQMSQMSQMGQQPMNQGMNQPMNQGMGAGMPQMQPQMNMNQGMPQMSQMSQMGQQPMNQGMSAGMPQMPGLSANNFVNLASGMPDELPFN